MPRWQPKALCRPSCSAHAKGWLVRILKAWRLAMDTTIPIIDGHMHLWDIDKNYYPWLTDQMRALWIGDYAKIRRNYLVSDYLRDAEGENVVKSVHLQA